MKMQLTWAPREKVSRLPVPHNPKPKQKKARVVKRPSIQLMVLVMITITTSQQEAVQVPVVTALAISLPSERAQIRASQIWKQVQKYTCLSYW